MDKQKNLVVMTGVYRSGTEYALQLLQGTDNTICEMYKFNVFRYLTERSYEFGSEILRKQLREFLRVLDERYNIKIKDSDYMLKIKNEYTARDKITRTDIYRDLIFSHYAGVKKENIIEKTQLNWTKTQEILEDDEKTKVILIYRDPRAALLSFKKYTNAPKPAYLGTIFNYLSFFQTAEKIMKEFDNKRLMLYSYESIIQDPQKYREKVQNFLRTKCSSYSKNDWIDYDGTKWIANTTEENKGKFNAKENNLRWKKELNKDEIYLIEYILGEFMCSYGYKLENDALGSQPKMLNELQDHESTKYMLQKYIEEGSGTEAFPTNPTQPSSWHTKN